MTQTLIIEYALRMKKYILKLAILILATQSMNAQVTGVSVETYYSYDGLVAGYPEGHTTYRIYANLTNSNDRLTAVYGGDEAPLFINVSGNGIWNEEHGGRTAFQNNCADHETTPATEYDSFLAIGYGCNSGSVSEVYAMDDPNISTWIDESFDALPYGLNNIVVNTNVGALWFDTPNNDNTQAGEELRVLIAQITTNGDICGTVNFQVFPEYEGIGSEYIEQTGFAFNSASSGDIVITTNVVPPSCFGDENASIEVSASGGTGELSFSFDNITYGDVNVLEGLAAGTYEVFVQDEAGCVATDIIDIVDPLAIFATAEVSDITCHDAADGEIHINSTGGTGMLVFSLDGENYLPSPDFENLPAGTYNIHITDMNNCSFDSQADIVLVNPEEIVGSLQTTDVSCFGAGDGVITIEVAGGVGPYEFNYGEGYSIENPIVDVPFGTYTVLVKDALGCIYTIPDLALVAQPSELVITGLQPINITDGVPGGNTSYTVEGGIFPFTFEWTDEDGNVVSSSEDLPQLFGQSAAGDYTLTVTDEMGCTLVQTITISYTVNVDEIAAEYMLEIFPNPTTGLFTLSLFSRESKSFGYQLKDATGRTVRSSKLSTVSAEFNEQIDITDLAPGIYFMETRADKVSKTIRVIKL